MGERVEFDGDHIRVLDSADRVIWSDTQRPINLLPDAFTINATIDMQFPDMDKSFAHIRTLTAPDISGNQYAACSCYSTIKVGAEWGPGESSPYNLPSTALGEVPAGVNYLDIRVTLSRTLAHTNYMGVTIHNELPEEETLLPGGSMELESTPLWFRGAWIGLDGDDVVLHRYQTLGTGGLVVPNATTDGSGSGWYRPLSGVGNYRFGTLQSQAGPVIWVNPGTSLTYNNGGCPPGTLPNWAARWQGTAVIRPGYVAL